MAAHRTRRPAPRPERRSGKTSPAVLLAGLVLLAAGITLIYVAMKQKAANQAPANEARQPLEAPGKPADKRSNP